MGKTLTFVMNDQQVEFYIRQLLAEKDRQAAQLAMLNASMATLLAQNIGIADSITALGNQSTSINAGAIDTYVVGGNIIHKLKTIFEAAVSFAKTILVTGIATFTASPVFSSTTASRPLKVDGTKALTSGKIDLASTTNDVTGTLARGNGGLGNTAVTAYAGTISGVTAGGTFTGTITGTANLTTGAVTGTCSGTTSADAVSGTSSTNV